MALRWILHMIWSTLVGLTAPAVPDAVSSNLALMQSPPAIRADAVQLEDLDNQLPIQVQLPADDSGDSD